MLHRDIKGGRRLRRLQIDVKLPSTVAKGHKQSNQHDDERELPVRDDSFGAVLDGFLDFVLLQFFARNMFGHSRSPDWFGTHNRSIRARLLEGLERGLQARSAGFTLPSEKMPGVFQGASDGVNFEGCRRLAFTVARSTC